MVFVCGGPAGPEAARTAALLQGLFDECVYAGVVFYTGRNVVHAARQSRGITVKTAEGDRISALTLHEKFPAFAPICLYSVLSRPPVRDFQIVDAPFLCLSRKHRESQRYTGLCVRAMPTANREIVLFAF